MSEETSVCFGPFRLDLADERLWCGQEACKVTHKAFAVLRYLVEHPERLVIKEELFKAIWPEVVVGDAALAVCARELRRVLGDTTKPPQYIETVHGRGYRFIAPLTAAPPVQRSKSKVLPQPRAPNTQHPSWWAVKPNSHSSTSC